MALFPILNFTNTYFLQTCILGIKKWNMFTDLLEVWQSHRSGYFGGNSISVIPISTLFRSYLVVAHLRKLWNLKVEKCTLFLKKF